MKGSLLQRLFHGRVGAGDGDGVADDIARPVTQPEIVNGFVMNRATRRQFDYEHPVNWRQR